jgi:DNA-binding MarR family transcriptional regulator
MVLPQRPPREVDNEIVAILLGGDPAQFTAPELRENSTPGSTAAPQPALPTLAAESGAPLPFSGAPERAPAPVTRRGPAQAAPKQAAASKTKARAATARAAAAQAQEASITTFAEFVERWKHGLRKGQFSVCEALYQKTHAIGATECLTSFAELARLSGLQMRQCFNIISQLEALGFVERARSLDGSNKKDQGSIIRFHLFPKQ